MKRLLLIFVLVPSILYAQKQARDTAGPEFHFITKRFYDFGSVLKNSKVSYEFQFRNTGNKPLVITDMHSGPSDVYSQTCKLQINWPQQPVKPGKKGAIAITVSALDDGGSFKNEIYVTSNATSDNYPLLLIAGAVIPVTGQPEKEYVPLTPLGALVGAFLENNIKK